MGGLMTACTQPGCPGTIVDDYCGVCGSPAGAPPFVPAGTAARQPNLAEEERPAQRMPRVQMTTQPSSSSSSSTQETADPAAADPGAPGIEKVDDEKVDPAAAHQELSRALAWSSYLGDIELMIASIRSGTWKVDAETPNPVAADTEQADTENAAPTATQPADTKQADTEKTDAAPTATEPVDTKQADPTAADTEKADAAPTGPDNPDTVEMPPVGAVLSGGRQPRPQLVRHDVASGISDR